MIEIRGPNVFAGYWRSLRRRGRNSVMTALHHRGSRPRRYARLPHHRRRAKDLVISALQHLSEGNRSEIDALPGVIESAVFGVPHPDFGEGVTAAVVRATGAPPLSEAEALAALRVRLAGYKLPKRVIFVEDLPRNSMGKWREAAAGAVRRSLCRLNVDRCRAVGHQIN